MKKKIFGFAIALVMLVAVHMIFTLLVTKSPELTLDEAYEPVVTSVMEQAKPHVTGDQYRHYEEVYADAQRFEGMGALNCWYKQIIEEVSDDLADANPSLAREIKRQRSELTELEQRLMAISSIDEGYVLNPVKTAQERVALIGARDNFLASR